MESNLMALGVIGKQFITQMWITFKKKGLTDFY